MFKPQYTPLALIIGSLISPASFADDTLTESSNDDIVISASRVETKRVETGSSITVLDEQYLKENQSRTVAEVLRDIPGVSVANTGGFGKATSVFIRGASSSNTLVIIDGVTVTDLSSSSGGFDFAHLMTDNIERIEVLRGPQSALWGSDAMGGVINITTKKGENGFNPNGSIEIGENNYHKENVNISGTQGNGHYSLSLSNLKTDGISAKTGDTDNSDDDGYKNQTIALKTGYQLSTQLSIDGVARYTDTESEYDSSGVDDPYSDQRQRLAKINTHLNLLENTFKNRLSLSYLDTVSQYYSEGSTYGDYSKYSGDKLKTELQSDYLYKIGNDFESRITLVGETEKATYLAYSTDEEEEIRSSSAIAEYAINWNHKIFLTTSLRRDFNSDFNNTTTHKFALTAWATDGIRLHLSQGTGVKNPTFSQLYGYYSNLNLTSETNESWDLGVEYNFEHLDGYVDITYFDANYDNAIRYDYDNYTYINRDEKTNGIEVSLAFKLTQAFRLNAEYTYMETDDGNGDELIRRPKHSASLNSNYKYTSKLSANIGVRYIGERRDYIYNEGYTTLDSYSVINIGASYQVNKHIGLSARLENAFNENYEEVSGYNTDDRTIYVGVNFK